jgi:predicted transcriptional regulator
MDPTTLNQNELEALRILWAEGELKPAEIQARFAWPIENATLRSVLRNLVESGHVARELRGKAFFYAARVPKAAILRNWLRHLARVFAGGSHQALVAQLVETADLAPADLTILHQTAAGKTGAKNKRKTK